jgi:threonine dehydrogenase-like Zn-dependent dehydrogenase
MKTTAVRMYDKMDLRLEEFDLPSPNDDEIVAHVISDSICPSTYKAAKQGTGHKRVPEDIADRPVMVGHEFCGEIIEVGSKWQDQFKPGQKFSIQPALNYKGTLYAPGYSYQYIGGDATNIVIPNEVMEMGCLLPYDGEAYFMGSLAEPMSCIVGTFKAMYHTTPGSYEHHMGIKEGGSMALLAGAGPMGIGTIDYAIHADRRPGLLVVTDIDQARLDRLSRIYTEEEAERNGVKLVYVNTKEIDDVPAHLKSYTPDGAGFDDVFAFAPVRAVVEQADQILGRDGCLNFFAGPTDPNFTAEINFYNVHYASTHVVGTSGGNTQDMIDSLKLMGEGRIQPAAMITHVGGLNAVVDTTIRMPEIPGGKKLIYTNIEMELTAIEDFGEKGKEDPFFRDLAEICGKNNNMWSAEAERYVLEHGTPIQ